MPRIVTRPIVYHEVLLRTLTMASGSYNERPTKRQKLDIQNARTLPLVVLLLSLPHLLSHPPTHKYHTRSLFLTLFALRKCLSLPNLDMQVECRAWTELAEVGLRIGLDEPGVESEVSKAISKAVSTIYLLTTRQVMISYHPAHDH